MSVVGHDIYWEDRDRSQEWLARPVPAAPPAVVGLGATIYLAGQPWPGVTVCVDQHPELPCATTGADGRATLNLPAASELVLTVTGAGLAGAVIGVATGTHNVTAWNIGVERLETTASLYEEIGARFPDPEKGSVLVNAVGPRRIGAAGITVSTRTAPGTRAVYIDRDKRPNPNLTVMT